MLNEFSFKNLIYFELATSVPFGIKYKPYDPKRMLDCYLDPDIGIENALELFAIPYETKYWPKGIKSMEAFQYLDRWLAESPVLLGPIDMGCLVYLPQYHLYSGLDHYIVIVKKGEGCYWVCDPEKIPFAIITEEQLHKACISGSLEEGRGSYTIRRVLKKKDVLDITDELLNKILKKGLNNYKNSLESNYGGHLGLNQFAEDVREHLKDPSTSRALNHVFTNKIQNCILLEYFYKLYYKSTIDSHNKEAIKKVLSLQIDQKNLYAVILSSKFDGDALQCSIIPEILREIATQEKLIVDILLDNFKIN